jgi:hypothetical protein
MLTEVGEEDILEKSCWWCGTEEGCSKIANNNNKQ